MKILSLGQCAHDHGMLVRTLQGPLQATLVPVSSGEEAIEELRDDQFDLLLINRQLDLDGSSGVDWMTTIRKRVTSPPPMMLVSNFPEAQAEAQAAGALPGFGKAQLTDPHLISHILRRMSHAPSVKNS